MLFEYIVSQNIVVCNMGTVLGIVLAECSRNFEMSFFIRA